MSKILIDRSVVEQALEAMLKAGEQRGSTYTEFNAIEALRAALEKPQVEQEPVAWQSIEAMAAQRYKVVPSHDSMFYRHAVVAGDGTQQLYIGRETECENIARRFAGAFLDGAYEASLYTQPQNLSCKSNQARLATLWGYVKEQPQPQQLLTDLVRDAFFAGFTSVETYNDTLLNSAEEAWLQYKSAHYAKETK